MPMVLLLFYQNSGVDYAKVFAFLAAFQDPPSTHRLDQRHRFPAGRYYEVQVYEGGSCMTGRSYHVLWAVCLFLDR